MSKAAYRWPLPVSVRHIYTTCVMLRFVLVQHAKSHVKRYVAHTRPGWLMMIHWDLIPLYGSQGVQYVVLWVPYVRDYPFDDDVHIKLRPYLDLRALICVYLYNQSEPFVYILRSMHSITNVWSFMLKNLRVQFSYPIVMQHRYLHRDLKHWK